MALEAALTDIAKMPEGPERLRCLREVSGMLRGMPEEYIMEAYRLCPDLEAAEPIPDTDMDESEQGIASSLSQSELATIDAAILASAAPAWRKAARVIGGTLSVLHSSFPQLSAAFYLQRIAVLVQRGELQAQGDLRFMRTSEVRVAASALSAA